MGSITVIDREGKEHKLKASKGFTIMEIIRDAGLDIEAACGGCCSCATCHIYVDEKWLNKIPQAEEAEEDMIDMAFEPKKNSRLSCQIIVNDELDGLEVTTPEKQT